MVFGAFDVQCDEIIMRYKGILHLHDLSEVSLMTSFVKFLSFVSYDLAT